MQFVITQHSPDGTLYYQDTPPRFVDECKGPIKYFDTPEQAEQYILTSFQPTSATKYYIEVAPNE